MYQPIFRDRCDAGRRLAAALRAYAHRDDVIVLALPRGGVPVAYEVAQALNAPLDVFLVRKLGVPLQPEMAMGAIASGGVRVLNQRLIRRLGLRSHEVEAVAEDERRELKRREQVYRGDRQMPALHRKTVILIDDGLATGATMRAAVAALRQFSPAQVVIAVPVASEDVCAALHREVSAVVCLETPEPFRAIGLWYENFDQTSDEIVMDLLKRVHTK